MNTLSNISDIGVVQDQDKVHLEEFTVIDGKSFPKYIPQPVFLESEKVVFKSSYAPEHEKYRSLFKCHETKDDFFLHIPQQPKTTDECKSARKVQNAALNMSNAFSSDYHDEVNQFCSQLSKFHKDELSKGVETHSDLEADIAKLKEMIDKCSNKPYLPEVNKLREYHASLYHKYETELFSLN